MNGAKVCQLFWDKRIPELLMDKRWDANILANKSMKIKKLKILIVFTSE